MSTELDLNALRTLLLQRREEMQGVTEQGQASADTVELDQTKVGRLSRMDALQSQAMAKATNQRRDQELKRISAALKRLEEGDYGYCLACDEPIAPQRLQADPSAPLCIQCAEKKERPA